MSKLICIFYPRKEAPVQVIRLNELSSKLSFDFTSITLRTIRALF